MKRGRLFRLLYIVERARRGHPTVGRLAEDLGVSGRTILRDLDLLRDDWGAPLEFDWRARGFRLADPCWQPPVRAPEGWEGSDGRRDGAATREGDARLTAGEAVALVLALRAFDVLRGGGFEGAFRSLLDKLPRLLPEAVSVDPAALAQGVSFYFEPARGDPEAVAGTLERLRAAVEGRRVVRIQYYTASRDEETVRLVEPYHLRYHEGVWYLVGWCRWRQAMRTFAVDRVRRCEVLEETFPAPSAERFSPETYFGEAWRLQRGEELVRVTVRFPPEQARFMRGRTWHPTQEVREEPDGALVLSFRVLGLEEIARWLLQFGDRAEALEPPELRAWLAREAERLVVIYSGRLEGFR